MKGMVTVDSDVSEMRTVARDALVAELDDLLEARRFADYCPNGLQVEGRAEVRRVVSGVTASLALLRAATEAGADTVLVHHGWFWRGEDARVVGTKRARLALALASELNVIAYHLPLDAHPLLGNNAQLARRLGWPCDAASTGRFGADGLGWIASLAAPTDAGALCASIGRSLARPPLAVGALDRPIRRLAWCTGAAQSMLAQAIEAGADAFVSGEISEPTVHLAREAGVVYVAAGHHATEQWGVQALGEHLAERFGIEHRFIDDPNPA